MIKPLYKGIIRKLGLSVEHLKELRRRLTPENICRGPFVQGEKNCPNTTALAVKEGIERFKTTDDVKRLLRQHGVSSIELWIFYVLFDLPALMSERFFENTLIKLQTAVDELIKERQP